MSRGSAQGLGLGWLLAALLLVLGCGPARDSDLLTANPPRMPLAEAKRGLDLCDAYLLRICQCAMTQPELAADCNRARSLPDALRMQLRASTGEGWDGGVPLRARLELEAQARKTVAGCVELDAELDPATCTRVPPPTR